MDKETNRGCFTQNNHDFNFSFDGPIGQYYVVNGDSVVDGNGNFQIKTILELFQNLFHICHLCI